MFGLIVLEVGVGLAHFEYAFLNPIIDSMLCGVGFEGGKGAPVHNELRYELLEVLMHVLIPLLYVLQLV